MGRSHAGHRKQFSFDPPSFDKFVGYYQMATRDQAQTRW